MIFEVIGIKVYTNAYATCRQNWGQVAICIENICTLHGTNGIRIYSGIYSKKISMHIGVYSDDIEISAIVRLLKSAGIRNTNTGNLNAFVSGLM